MALVCACGTVLLESVGPDSITTLDGQEIPFRRTTDYVICDVCDASFRVDQLREVAGVAS